MERNKYLVLVISGLSDLPMEQLGGKTPLEAARCPNLDALSIRGRLGLVEIVGEEGTAGSDRALFSLLGYDPDRYPVRRGPLEAVGLEIPLEGDDLAFRFNFVSTFNGILADHNAGQISGAEAATLVKMLNARLGDDRIRFHAGVGYRNLLVVKGGKGLDITTVPPQEALHQPVVDFMPYGRDAEMIADLMRRAHEILKEHEQALHAIADQLQENEVIPGEEIARIVAAAADSGTRLVVTSGGTGLGPREGAGMACIAAQCAASLRPPPILSPAPPLQPRPSPSS